MNKAEAMEAVKSLAERKKLSAANKETIASIYAVVFGRKFVQTSCNNCYKDAAIEIYTYLNRGGEFASTKAYKMQAGVLLQLEFGSNQFVSSLNINDELARKVLRKNPANIRYFYEYPDNWEEDIKEAE